MEQEITAWITRYALTDGIQKVQGKINQEHPKVLNFGWSFYANNQEWFPCQQDALDRAETMRANKIRSLEKQLAKLHALKIQVVDKTK